MMLLKMVLAKNSQKSSHKKQLISIPKVMRQLQAKKIMRLRLLVTMISRLRQLGMTILRPRLLLMIISRPVIEKKPQQGLHHQRNLYTGHTCPWL